MTTLTKKDQRLTALMRRIGSLHTALLRKTRGRGLWRFRGGDLVLLTHTGRRSGRRFTTPLLHLRDGEDVLVAASNGGVDAEPQWWLNLQTTPYAEVEIRGERWAVVAEAIPDAERAAVWERFRQVGGYFDGYQATVSRTITLVRLRPWGR
ncbi:nitroreductase/quinone reductase family protein [Pseudonocardia xishanensis]|uniref:Nitroreductase family deazaflavin-dependent oxidoreductase n=1 Tax=Pseudonocardia xishanensis TaxID=630995 RepID=A0ABP8RF86_9PSEU